MMLLPTSALRSPQYAMANRMPMYPKEKKNMVPVSSIFLSSPAFARRKPFFC